MKTLIHSTAQHSTAQHIVEPFRYVMQLGLALASVVFTLAVMLVSPPAQATLTLTPSTSCGAPKTGYTCVHYVGPSTVYANNACYNGATCYAAVYLFNYPSNSSPIFYGVASDSSKAASCSAVAGDVAFYLQGSGRGILATLTGCSTYRAPSGGYPTITVGVTSGDVFIPNNSNVCVVYATNWQDSIRYVAGGCSDINVAPLPPPVSCNVTQPGTVQMDGFNTGQFGSTGKISASTKPVKISITCTGSMKMSVTPSGNSPTTPGVYKNTGTAQNVDVLIECAGLGTDSNGYYALISNQNWQLGTSGTTDLYCRASYYNNGSPSAGTVSTSTTFTFTYQ
jgi:hypothetical protein